MCHANVLSVTVAFTARLFLLLCVWVWIGTLAWADSLDLTDELAWPITELQQVIEPAWDEAKDSVESSEHTQPVVSFFPLSLSRSSLRPATTEAHRHLYRDRPVYERHAIYRL